MQFYFFFTKFPHLGPQRIKKKNEERELPDTESTDGEERGPSAPVIIRRNEREIGKRPSC